MLSNSLLACADQKANSQQPVASSQEPAASGQQPPIPTSPQKGGDRHALHDSASGQRRDLPRRDGTGSAKSFPGAARGAGRSRRGPRRPRAKQEIDYGRRGSGYVFGAFIPATGAAFTAAATRAARRPTGSTSWSEVEAWLDPAGRAGLRGAGQPASHRATDVLLWALAHPRWEFVFQPTYAAYLNLIEPWWKVLRSLALKGRRAAS